LTGHTTWFPVVWWSLGIDRDGEAGENAGNPHEATLMDRKPEPPICKAFLVCRQIVGETLTLIGQSNCHVNRRFPSGQPLAFFARLKNGRGRYAIEVQLQDADGAVLWRDGPPAPWSPASPLDTMDITLNLVPIFPGPGDYSLVLTANDEEIGREFFAARLAPLAEAK
jgi:hypothetical protein